ncbi:flavin-containing monooxygenase [Demequina capsici]|uniref:NAD(P)-binding domain-containing protein n=1 Tax=Demequina capsici TaxID=3075620 RepID=A0AA96F9Z1_9MICO|nr:NAD(P)-binding domain-containing protein [Demequina sp. OYTSA14]WNM24335.1 NAD(P)-binding domain-containing protein [Demequina sp. OYTSA14]
MGTERIDTVVIGGGQAGLAMGYRLKERGIPHVILDASDRVGDAWRTRWDSLTLFTPARYSGLPGTPYPAPPQSYPTREQFADYLERYAAVHGLPVRSGTRVTRLGKDHAGFVVETATDTIHADRVVLAAGYDALPQIPAFASQIDPGTVQLHSSEYRRPSDVPAGYVLVVGAGNSGADISLELAQTHHVVLAGRHPGQIPFHIDSRLGRRASRVVFWVFSHVLTLDTPMGRRAAANLRGHGGPLIRVKTADIAAAGVRRVGRIARVDHGRPVTDAGEELDVAAIVWCTGFHADGAWLDLPDIQADGLPAHDRGICRTQPGLYVLGALFQRSLASSMIHGVALDAAWIADRMARSDTSAPTPAATEPR